jgi:hypothetical protein
LSYGESKNDNILGDRWMSTCIIWSRINLKIKPLIEKVIETEGITYSEYIRQLILKDLKERSILTSILKRGLK